MLDLFLHWLKRGGFGGNKTPNNNKTRAPQEHGAVALPSKESALGKLDQLTKDTAEKVSMPKKAKGSKKLDAQ